MKSIKMIAILLTPLLLFAILLVPYSLVNQHFIVDWLGCGCPVIDEAGNMVENNFNANDFTALFWLFISICVTAISVFLSKRIQKEKIWLRVLYVVGMLLLSLLITYQFYQMMMWNQENSNLSSSLRCTFGRFYPYLYTFQSLLRTKKHFFRSAFSFQLNRN